MQKAKKTAIATAAIGILVFDSLVYAFSKNNFDHEKALLLSGSTAAVYRSPELGKSIPYRLFKPENATDEEKPLVLFLQSGAGRGSDNLGQIKTEVKSIVQLRKECGKDFYLIAPQCPEKIQWNNIVSDSPPYVNYSYTDLAESWRFLIVIELLRDVIKKNNIDKDRIYITGISMGATATWEFLFRHPDFFAGAVILNGRADPAAARQIAKTPVWLAHGIKDRISPISNSEEMVTELRRYNANLYFEPLNAGHQVSKRAYSCKSFTWLLQHRKTSSL